MDPKYLGTVSCIVGFSEYTKDSDWENQIIQDLAQRVRDMQIEDLSCKDFLYILKGFN